MSDWMTGTREPTAQPVFQQQTGDLPVRCRQHVLKKFSKKAKKGIVINVKQI